MTISLDKSNKARVSEKTNSQKIINKVSQLPNLSGGVSTLEPGTNYKFRSGLVIDDIDLVVQEGTQLSGDGVFSDSVVFNSAGTTITSNGVSFSIKDLSITCPNVTEVLDCTGSVLNTCFADAFQITDSTKLGSFNGMAQVFNNFTGVRFTDGFSYTGGPIIGYSMVNAFMQDVSASAIHFDFDDVVFLQAALRAVLMTGTGTCFSSSVGGQANIIPGTDAIVSDCSFGVLGGMTALTGFDEDFQTVAWEFVGNSPTSIVQDTREVSNNFLLTPNTIIVGDSEVFYEIGVPGAGVFSSTLSDRFTPNADGSMTYIGHKPLKVKIFGKSTVHKATGGSDTIMQRVAINWVPGDNGLIDSTGTTENNSPTQVTSDAEVTISPLDNVRIIFANYSTSANIVVDISKIYVERVS